MRDQRHELGLHAIHFPLVGDVAEDVKAAQVSAVIVTDGRGVELQLAALRPVLHNDAGVGLFLVADGGPGELIKRLALLENLEVEVAGLFQADTSDTIFRDAEKFAEAAVDFQDATIGCDEGDSFIHTVGDGPNASPAFTFRPQRFLQISFALFQLVGNHSDRQGHDYENAYT